MLISLCQCSTPVTFLDWSSIQLSIRNKYFNTKLCFWQCVKRSLTLDNKFISVWSTMSCIIRNREPTDVEKWHITCFINHECYQCKLLTHKSYNYHILGPSRDNIHNWFHTEFINTGYNLQACVSVMALYGDICRQHCHGSLCTHTKYNNVCCKNCCGRLCTHTKANLPVVKTTMVVFALTQKSKSARCQKLPWYW